MMTIGAHIDKNDRLVMHREHMHSFTTVNGKKISGLPHWNQRSSGLSSLMFSHLKAVIAASAVRNFRSIVLLLSSISATPSQYEQLRTDDNRPSPQKQPATPASAPWMNARVSAEVQSQQ